jgi:hypothetical protein
MGHGAFPETRRAPEITIPLLPDNRAIAGDMCAAALFVLAMALGSCAQQPRDQDYARSILDRPLPSAREGALQECDFLASEIVRQENATRLVPQDQLLPETVLAIQKATQTNIAALKLRAKQLACPPSASTGWDQPDNKASRP